MQLLANDVTVNDQPKFLANNLTEEYHAIISPRNDRYKIPLCLQSLTSYLTTSNPTVEYFETYPKIELTYMYLGWNPSLPSFSEQ